MATDAEIEAFLSMDEGSVDRIERTGSDPVDRIKNVVGNQSADREKVKAQFGRETALPDTRNETQVRQPTEEELFKEKNPFVDMNFTTPIDDRLKIMMTRGENQNRLLDKMFKAGGWRRDGSHIIFSDSQGQEHLLDEFGLTFGDIADVADMGIDVAGAVAGGAAGVARKMGATGVIAMEAVGTAVAGSLADWFSTIGAQDGKRAWEIAKDRGPDALLDFALGKGVATAGRAFVGATPGKGETVGSVNDAIERINKFADSEFKKTGKGMTAPLTGTVGQRTGNPAFQRIEAVGAKIPFVDSTFVGQRATQETALREAQEMLVNSQKGRAEDIAQSLNSQYDTLLDAEKTALKKVDDLIQGQIDEVGDVLSKNGDAITGQHAADIYRNRQLQHKVDFDTRAQVMYSRVDDLPGGQDQIVDVAPVREAVDALFKGGLPTSTVDDVTDVAEVFAPRDARAALKSLQTLDNMTLRQARNARSIIWDRMQNAQDGIPKKVLSDVYHQLSGAIDSAVQNLPEETADALKAANSFYKNNVEQFSTTGVKESLVRFGEKGYTENKNLLMRTFMSGDSEVIQRAMKSLEPDERKVVMRGVFNDVLQKSRSVSGEGTDLVKFRDNILSMPRAVLESLFGVKNSDDIMGVLKSLSARDGTLEIGVEQMVRGDVKSAIRNAATLSRQKARDFENQILRPFLKDPKTGDPAAMAKDLPKHLFSEGVNPVVRTRVIQRLAGTQEHEALKRVTLEKVFNQATGEAGSTNKIAGFIEEGDEILIGRRLQSTLNEFNKDGALEELVGKEAMGVMRSIAKVRSVSDDIAASTAGGLIAGSLIMKGLGAAKTVSAYKIAAWALTSDKIAKLASTMSLSRPLGSATRRELTPKEGFSIGLVMDVILDARREFNDDPDMNEFLHDWFRDRGIPVGPQEQEGSGSNADIAQFLGVPPEEVNAILQGAQ